MRSSEAMGDLSYTMAVALVALLPRLFVAVAWAHEPVWDGHYYHFGATRIAEGLGYSEDVVINGESVWKPWTHYPVGYSAFLGLVYRIFGSGLLVAPLVNAFVGTLLVVVVHRLARHGLSEQRARVAAGITALHPGLIAYAALVMTEQLAALLILTTLLLVLMARPRWVEAAVGGLALGLALLVRPAALLLAPILALIHGRPWRTALLRAAMVTAVGLLVVVPWTVRNCRVMDGCALVSTNAGWNLAIGAISETGRFQTLHASDGCAVVTGQVQQDRCWTKVGLSRIAKDPVRWLGLAPKKLSQTYDHESFPVEYLHQANPQDWPEPRRVAGRLLLTWFHWFLLIAAGLSAVGWCTPRRGSMRAVLVQGGLGLAVIGYGLWAALQDAEHPFYWIPVLLPVVALLPLPGRPAFTPALRGLLGLVAITTLTHAVFFGDDRYHMVLSPALCVLAAAALRSESRRPRGETRKRASRRSDRDSPPATVT